MLHDHITRVGHNQRNLVRGNQNERVSGNQDQYVGGTRQQTIVGNEREVTSGSSTKHVEESASFDVGGTYRIRVRNGGMITELARGEYTVISAGRMLLAQHQENSISMVSRGPDKGVFMEAKGATIHLAEDKIEMKVGGSTLLITANAIRVNDKTMPAPGGTNGDGQ